jgi:hypothetical protein
MTGGAGSIEVHYDSRLFTKYINQAEGPTVPDCCELDISCADPRCHTSTLVTFKMASDRLAK